MTDGKWRDVPIIGGFYRDDTRPWNCQDAVNWRPVKAERPGGRSAWQERTCAGLYGLGQIGTGPHRGAITVEGKPFLVSGTTLYRVYNNRSYRAIGTIPGTGLVSMSYNQIAHGNELTVGNGSAGYVYDTTTDTLVRITDAGFPGFKDQCFLGQMTVGIEPQGRYFFNSDLAASKQYNTIYRYSAESKPDRLVAGKAVNGRYLALGTESGEVWVNEPVVTEGITTAYFQRDSSTLLEQGCAATFTLCKFDNGAAWLGSDRNVYLWKGGIPFVISTGAMADAIAEYDPSLAFAFVIKGKGFEDYCLTFRDGMTFVYDVTVGEWHRRQSYGLTRWRANTAFEWQGRWYCGDYRDGTVYLLDWDYVGEGSDPLIRERISQVAHGDENRLFIDAIQLRLGTGVRSKTPNVEPFWEAIVIDGEISDGLTNDVIDVQFTVTGGTAPLTWEVVGDLPDALTHEGDGHFTGWHAVIDTHAFQIKVTDAVGRTGTLDVSFATGGYPFVYALSDSSSPAADRIYRIGYGAFNRFDYINHVMFATFDKVGGYSAIGNPGVIVDGRLISRIEYDDSGAQVSGLYSLEWDGEELTQKDLWQRSATIQHEYKDHAKWDATTVIATVNDKDDGLDCHLVALTLANGLFTLAGELEIDTAGSPETSLAVHDSEAGKCLVVFSYDSGNVYLKAYDWDGADFTLLDTYGGSLAGGGTLRDDLVANGRIIVTPTGHIFTWSGTAFVLADTFTVNTYCRGLSVYYSIADDKHYIRFLDSDNALVTWQCDVDGQNATLTDTVAGDFDDIGRCDSIQDDAAVDEAVRARQGEYLMPEGDFYGTAVDNGVFYGTDTLTFSEPFLLDYDMNDELFRGTFRLLESELTAQ